MTYKEKYYDKAHEVLEKETLSDKRYFVSGEYVNKKNRGWNYPEKDVKEFIKELKDCLNKDLKEVLDGAIIIYTGKKKGVKHGKMINKNDIELKIIGCFIMNKIKELDKLAGKELVHSPEDCETRCRSSTASGTHSPLNESFHSEDTPDAKGRYNRQRMRASRSPETSGTHSQQELSGIRDNLNRDGTVRPAGNSCSNCGHEKDRHMEGGCWKRESKLCECKKYTTNISHCANCGCGVNLYLMYRKKNLGVYCGDKWGLLCPSCDITDYTNSNHSLVAENRPEGRNKLVAVSSKNLGKAEIQGSNGNDNKSKVCLGMGRKVVKGTTDTECSCDSSSELTTDNQNKEKNDT